MDRNQGAERNIRAGTERARNFVEIAARGTALLWDLQMEAARNVLHAQARAGALLGMPDFSNLFSIADDRAKRVFSTSAEQVISTTRQAGETLSEVQRQLGRLAEQQTIGITEEIRNGIDELGKQTQTRLEQIKNLTVEQVEESRRALEEANAERAAEQQRNEQQRAEQQRSPEQQPPAESGLIVGRQPEQRPEQERGDDKNRQRRVA